MQSHIPCFPLSPLSVYDIDDDQEEEEESRLLSLLLSSDSDSGRPMVLRELLSSPKKKRRNGQSTPKLSTPHYHHSDVIDLTSSPENDDVEISEIILHQWRKSGSLSDFEVHVVPEDNQVRYTQGRCVTPPPYPLDQVTKIGGCSGSGRCRKSTSTAPTESTGSELPSRSGWTTPQRRIKDRRRGHRRKQRQQQQFTQATLQPSLLLLTSQNAGCIHELDNNGGCGADGAGSCHRRHNADKKGEDSLKVDSSPKKYRKQQHQQQQQQQEEEEEVMEEKEEIDEREKAECALKENDELSSPPRPANDNNTYQKGVPRKQCVRNFPQISSIGLMVSGERKEEMDMLRYSEIPANQEGISTIFVSLSPHSRWPWWMDCNCVTDTGVCMCGADTGTGLLERSCSDIDTHIN